ncbi:MAG: hypothetical protein QOC66_1294, partial [Pseudonocardiales bacterium]|nr:hypothetical protein [Pseudonocardiales bacterium]
FNEAAHQLRLRILGQAGDRSGVIKAYEHCRAVLAEELGVEPSDETAAVFRAATTTAPPTEASPPAAVDGLAALSVLVVEDHDFQRRTAVMLVRKLGVGSVSEAADGVAALELLGGGLYPDVIVCDIDMPGMDGVAFIRHVAEGELAGAVVIASGLDAKLIRAVRSVAEGYGLQVLGAVEKPLSARRLGELLAAYRSRPRIHPADPLGMSAVEVAAALRDGRICIHLLPGVDASTAQVTTADAVPRWHDQARGWVPLGSIPALTERESLLAELSERALDVACDYLSGFARSGPDIGVCIDLAPASLRDTSLADRAADVARARGADPTRVTLAVDERALRTSPSTALDVLTRLRVKGFGVSLDNFGAGHASTEQLRRVPFTEVRLAPHLVTGAGGDGPRVRALEDAVAVGRELAGVIVGRGCESEDDLRLLLELGCDRVQGEFIAAAMPGEDLPGWVAAWDPLRLGSGGRE